MNQKESQNREMNYKKKSERSEETVNLFNCPVCGFHSMVIAKYWVKGFESDVSINFISIHPEKETTTTNINTVPLNSDGELIDEYICGKCGIIGNMESVPYYILEVYGYSPLNKKKEVKSKDSILAKGIKKLASLIRGKD
ncbi:MAG: hypothetical protein CMD65_02350 [Gammaproteobacteria bacterium]|nr:hypothetical protein [Gammaproteobacteria bacterium]